LIHADPFLIKCREGEPIAIKGLGDIHHLSIDSDEDRLVDDLRYRPVPQTYFINTGDSSEGIGPAHKYFSIDRIKPKFLASYDEAKKKLTPVKKPLLDAEIEDLAKTIKRHTKPEEWLGHVGGNHDYFQLGSGTDLSQRLCTQLNHRYLGFQAFVPLKIETPRGGVSVLMIFVCHGFGGGRKSGAGLNSYIDHAACYGDWDIALYGHRHDKWVKEVSYITPHFNCKTGERWIRNYSRVIAQTGTYLRTLSNGERPNYAEKGGSHPRPLGCIHVKFCVRRKKIDGIYRQVVEWIDL